MQKADAPVGLKARALITQRVSGCVQWLKLRNSLKGIAIHVSKYAEVLLNQPFSGGSECSLRTFPFFSFS